MDGKTFRTLALALPETSERPHFDRIAFRTPRRTFTTLSGDGRDANVMLEPDHQRQLAEARPEVFRAVAGGWGAQGWTTILLAKAKVEEVRAVLVIAHALAAPKAKVGRGKAGARKGAAAKAKAATPRAAVAKAKDGAPKVAAPKAKAAGAKAKTAAPQKKIAQSSRARTGQRS